MPKMGEKAANPASNDSNKKKKKRRKKGSHSQAIAQRTSFSNLFEGSREAGLSNPLPILLSHLQDLLGYQVSTTLFRLDFLRWRGPIGPFSLSMITCIVHANDTHDSYGSLFRCQDLASLSGTTQFMKQQLHVVHHEPFVLTYPRMKRFKYPCRMAASLRHARGLTSLSVTGFYWGREFYEELSGEQNLCQYPKTGQRTQR